MARGDHHHRLGIMGDQGVQPVQPFLPAGRGAGEIEIEQHHVGRIGGQGAPGLGGIARQADLHFMASQKQTRRGQNVLVVIDDKNMHFWA
jgi:hypothetical protein